MGLECRGICHIVELIKDKVNYALRKRLNITRNPSVSTEYENKDRETPEVTKQQTLHYNPKMVRLYKYRS